MNTNAKNLKMKWEKAYSTGHGDRLFQSQVPFPFMRWSQLRLSFYQFEEIKQGDDMSLCVHKVPLHGCFQGCLGGLPYI